ncbi:MAG: hypothetical protein Ct9H300mP32_6840 [Verrucomicrobiota bacterium]|nr:MAG: hypothetical protein Ct9H300mP32_6840 [Verrucomicrobiota bacterium]
MAEDRCNSGLASAGVLSSSARSRVIFSSGLLPCTAPSCVMRLARALIASACLPSRSAES